MNQWCRWGGNLCHTSMVLPAVSLDATGDTAPLSRIVPPQNSRRRDPRAVDHSAPGPETITRGSWDDLAVSHGAFGTPMILVYQQG
jgi:hypothetical protein